MADSDLTEIFNIETFHSSMKEHEHRMSSLNLFVFSLLLLFVTVFTWLLKKTRVSPYIHDSGIALISGFICGGIIRLTAKENPPTRVYVKFPYDNFSSSLAESFPDYVFLRLDNLSQSLVYQYKSPYIGEEYNDLAEKTIFNSDIFFNVILPPLIFEAGFSMRKRRFFKNFGGILTFAFLGTFVMIVVTSVLTYASTRIFKTLIPIIDCLFFGAIISSTDPVTVLSIFNDLKVEPDLYALILGESILNDALCITLANALDHYIAVSGSSAGGLSLALFKTTFHNFFFVLSGSVSIGMFMGFTTSFLLKFANMKNTPRLEIAVFILMSYMTFMLSEIAGVTGVVAVLICGIVQAHYTRKNISLQAADMLRQLFNFISFIGENFVFINIGVTLLTMRITEWSPSFIIMSIAAIIISRCVAIYGLSAMLNFFRPSSIPLNWQNMMIFSGMRGAMAFALAIRSVSSAPRQIILTATSIIVLLTVLWCGSLTNTVLKLLNIRVNVDSSQSENTGTGVNPPFEVMPKLANTHEHIHSSVHVTQPRYSLSMRMWHNIDDWYLTPIFTHQPPLPEQTFPKCLGFLARLLTSHEQRLHVVRTPFDDFDSSVLAFN